MKQIVGEMVADVSLKLFIDSFLNEAGQSDVNRPQVVSDEIGY